MQRKEVYLQLGLIRYILKSKATILSGAIFYYYFFKRNDKTFLIHIRTHRRSNKSTTIFQPHSFISWGQSICSQGWNNLVTSIFNNRESNKMKLQISLTNTPLAAKQPDLIYLVRSWKLDSNSTCKIPKRSWQHHTPLV